MFQKLNLLIFDLDFALFDCTRLKEAALRQSLIPLADSIPHSSPLPDAGDIQRHYREHGYRWPDFLELGLDQETMEGLRDRIGLREVELVDRSVGMLFPSVVELLQEWKKEGLRIALGADARRDYLLSVTDHFELDLLIDTILCTEEFGMGGAEEMIEDILRLNQVHSSETVVLATQPSFFRAARNLDILSVACGWGIHPPPGPEEADFLASTVAGIDAVLRQADRPRPSGTSAPVGE